MKTGLIEGKTVTIQTKVTKDMFAQFEGEIVHPVYSTVSMVYHMEWASRQIILPFLENHEEGMGAAVTLKHIAPSKEGSLLTISAIVDEIQGNTVLTKVTIKNKKQIVGIGEVKQVILPKAEIELLI